VFALVGWIGVFVTPGLQPGGWKYMVYAFGTILAGFAAYLILAWHKARLAVRAFTTGGTHRTGT
jgi:hypothetical protein